LSALCAGRGEHRPIGPESASAASAASTVAAATAATAALRASCGPAGRTALRIGV